MEYLFWALVRRTYLLSVWRQKEAGLFFNLITTWQIIAMCVLWLKYIILFNTFSKSCHNSLRENGQLCNSHLFPCYYCQDNISNPKPGFTICSYSDVHMTDEMGVVIAEWHYCITIRQLSLICFGTVHNDFGVALNTKRDVFSPILFVFTSLHDVMPHFPYSLKKTGYLCVGQYGSASSMLPDVANTMVWDDQNCNHFPKLLKV